MSSTGSSDVSYLCMLGFEFFPFNLIAADDSQRLQSFSFLYVRKLAKLQEKKLTNQLSSLVSIFGVIGSVKINWRHLHC